MPLLDPPKDEACARPCCHGDCGGSQADAAPNTASPEAPSPTFLAVTPCSQERYSLRQKYKTVLRTKAELRKRDGIPIKAWSASPLLEPLPTSTRGKAPGLLRSDLGLPAYGSIERVAHCLMHMISLASAGGRRGPGSESRDGQGVWATMVFQIVPAIKASAVM